MYIRQQTMENVWQYNFHILHILYKCMYKLIDQSHSVLLYLYESFCKFWAIHESIRVFITLGIDTKYRSPENNTNYIWNTSICVKCRAHIARGNRLRNNLLSTTTPPPQRRRWGIFIRVNDLRAGASFVRKRGDTQSATTSGIERRIIVSNNPGRRFSSVPMATWTTARLLVGWQSKLSSVERQEGREGARYPYRVPRSIGRAMVGKEA